MKLLLAHQEREKESKRNSLINHVLFRKTFENDTFNLICLIKGEEYLIKIN